MVWPFVLLGLYIVINIVAGISLGIITSGEAGSITNDEGFASLLGELVYAWLPIIMIGASVLIGPISFIIGLVLLVVRSSRK